MLELLRDLIAHKGFANAALLTAVQQNEAAASDPEVCELLQHILLANRFWLYRSLGCRSSQMRSLELPAPSMP
jgi:hypothetical protein